VYNRRRCAVQLLAARIRYVSGLETVSLTTSSLKCFQARLLFPNQDGTSLASGIEFEGVNLMYDPRPHQMRLERIDSSGSEEWLCPTCGRRVLMRWAPGYAKAILAAGDERASHTGGAGIRARAPLPSPEADEDALNEGLRPWLKWIHDSGFHHRLAAW
jgi:hypothetical protein